MTKGKLIISLQPLLLASAFLLNGCAPAVVVGAAGAGVATKTATEERGIHGASRDSVIANRIAYLWFKHDREMFKMVNVSVREGVALITGAVDTHQRHLEAIRLAWQAEGVREVIDDIKLASHQGGTGDYARDGWITTKVKSLMLVDKAIASRNYNIKTVGAVVYIMGIAQSQEELNKVISLAKSVEKVRKVVSYVRVKEA